MKLKSSRWRTQYTICYLSETCIPVVELKRLNYWFLVEGIGSHFLECPSLLGYHTITGLAFWPDAHARICPNPRLPGNTGFAFPCYCSISSHHSQLYQLLIKVSKACAPMHHLAYYKQSQTIWVISVIRRDNVTPTSARNGTALTLKNDLNWTKRWDYQLVF